MSLNFDDVENSAKYCAASAALPFGIVPYVEAGGEKLVDGGVVDNTPIHPLVGLVDEIVVVLLEPHPTEAEALEAYDLSKRKWSELRRLIELADYEPTSYDGSIWHRLFGWMRRPSVIPFCDPNTWPKIRVICPHKKLGGFVSGTLRFDKSYAKRLIKIGRSDALKSIESWRVESPPR